MVLWWTTIWWRFCYGTENIFQTSRLESTSATGFIRGFYMKIFYRTAVSYVSILTCFFQVSAIKKAIFLLVSSAFLSWWTKLRGQTRLPAHVSTSCPTIAATAPGNATVGRIAQRLSMIVGKGRWFPYKKAPFSVCLKFSDLTLASKKFSVVFGGHFEMISEQRSGISNLR